MDSSQPRGLPSPSSMGSKKGYNHPSEEEKPKGFCNGDIESGVSVAAWLQFGKGTRVSITPGKSAQEVSLPYHSPEPQWDSWPALLTHISRFLMPNYKAQI